MSDGMLELWLRLLALHLPEPTLKAHPDGTMVDGHHRIKILRDRGIDVDSLPREIIPKDSIPDSI